MKHPLIIKTPQAGHVLLVPREDSRNVRLTYLETDDPLKRSLAAQYLVREGFVAYAAGRLEIDGAANSKD
jgi:hypothetical protein